MLRASTLSMLLTFQQGSTPLSVALKQSLASDPIDPVLEDKHLLALDRRVVLILDMVRECLKNTDSAGDVVFANDDDYNNVKPNQEVDDGHFFS